jgi:lipopolysaccharide transport system ATP-binding protein
MLTAIKAENISKAYRLGEIGTGTISRDLERWVAKIRGKEDPYLKIGEANDRTVKGTSDVVWSLKDVNFEIQQGDAVGIIGRNGAGKSTLLKLLSRVTSPTTGDIFINGRIASLLEVGTGFHPELTGRENVYLNGAILGMRKKEITRKFDEIVDFSGVERYIDTPVKRYSSGMYVRLAFAVAAYLESEILIVDEVLSVGDAEFQKKCIGKMDDVSKGGGRTVLFVSHNMGSVAQLCTKGILMKNGQISNTGTINNVINSYLQDDEDTNHIQVQDDINKPVQILNMRVVNSNGKSTSSVKFSDRTSIEFAIKNLSDKKGMVCSVEFKDKLERKIFTEQISLDSYQNVTSFLLTIPENLLRPNSIVVTIVIHIPNVKVIDASPSISFEVIDTGTEFSIYGDVDNGIIFSGAKLQVTDSYKSLSV